jgi:rhamnose utilization protein RhaD (predicted bifunctional aldolase and dehydrogenase)
MSTTDPTLDQLVNLSQNIAREERQLAILGEGNTSADAGDGSFWVKGSGCQMRTITAGGFARVRYDDALAVLDQDGLDNQQVNERLEAIRMDPAMKRPSVETFLHALCLTEGGATWVGHTHTTSMLKILCSRLGAEPFMKNIYPDVIVVCGRHVAVVPYIDPGLELARAVRDELRRFKGEHGKGPKLLLMVNHGPVALGQSAREVENILLMADKWARVLVGTYALGGPRYMPESEAGRIDGRPDEDYRRRQLSS